ncbi:hypothetical protein [Actinosynnema sp. NPDC020468]|uniref:hypothetical protein n=1 Tax=Actinosynnema sp. NPDC020468 TaxID=3154488 RepID=UPI0033DDA7E1
MTHAGRTLTLHWDDSHVVGRWCDDTETEPAPRPEGDDRPQWVFDLIAAHRLAYPGARVRATNRASWPVPARSVDLAPLHFHRLPGQQAKECWHRCPGV